MTSESECDRRQHPSMMLERLAVYTQNVDATADSDKHAR
jgi:hypothetical protein